MTRVTARTLSLLLCSGFLCAAIACSSHMAIQDITRSPGRFHDQHVVVRGTVTKTWALPIFGESLVQIEDETGQIWVKPHGRVPFEGDEIEVSGTLRIGMTVANRNLGVIVYEDRAPRR